MTPIGYLLLVAYELIWLTFTLGVLVLALPVPLRGLKVWGGRMIADSIAAFILLSAYTTLVNLSNAIPPLLGWSWDGFYQWYTSSLTLVVGVKTLIASLLAAAKTFNMAQLASALLSPIDRISTIMLLTLLTVGALASIVRTTYTYLAALGIALYAMPLRVGKSAGAWLLSFAIVFNAGLPLLPLFLSNSMGGQSSIPTGLGATFAQVSIESYSGDPVTSGYVEVYAPVNGTLERVALYHISQDGLLRGKYGSGYVSMPSSAPSYWLLVIDSVYIPLHPLPLNGTDALNLTESGYTGVLRASNLVYQRGYTIAYYSDGSVDYLSAGPYGFNLTIELPQGEYVEVLTPSGCSASITYSGDGQVEEGSWEWAGLTGSYLRYTALAGGVHTLSVAISGSCNAKPEMPPQEDYALDYLGLASISVDRVPKMLLSLILLPSIYLFMLTSLTAALARFLGGRERFLPRL